MSISTKNRFISGLNQPRTADPVTREMVAADQSLIDRTIGLGLYSRLIIFSPIAFGIESIVELVASALKRVGLPDARIIVSIDGERADEAKAFIRNRQEAGVLITNLLPKTNGCPLRERHIPGLTLPKRARETTDSLDDSPCAHMTGDQLVRWMRSLRLVALGNARFTVKKDGLARRAEATLIWAANNARPHYSHKLSKIIDRHRFQASNDRTAFGPKYEKRLKEATPHWNWRS